MSDAGDGPLWLQVLEDLERRLAAGDIDDRFPTDKELVEHYQVSRHTVREAVRHLKARGLVSRQRGRGSFVRRVDVAQQAGTLYSLFREVEARGMAQTSEVLEQGLRHDAAAAARFDLPADTEVFHLQRVRNADDVPLALDSIWLPPDVGGAVLEVDFAHTALYDELERALGIRLDGGQEIVSAVSARPADRELLDMDDDEALLRIERLGTLGDRLVECRITLVRGNRFSLVSELRPSRADQGPHVALDTLEGDALGP